MAALAVTVGIVGGLNDGLYQVSSLPGSDEGVGYPVVTDGIGERGADLDDEANRWTGSRAVPGRVEEGLASEGRTPSANLSNLPRLSSPSLGSVALEAVICAEETPWLCDWALATVQCESGGNPTAWATELVEVFIDGVWVWVQYYFHGLWQIVSTSPDPGRLADLVYNTERAVEKYIDEGPANAWPSCP